MVKVWDAAAPLIHTYVRTYQGAKNMIKTDFPAVIASKFSTVSCKTASTDGGADIIIVIIITVSSNAAGVVGRVVIFMVVSSSSSSSSLLVYWCALLYIAVRTHRLR